jgi:hypothetical protein
MWTACGLGKWCGKGMTLPQILLADPDFFFWAVEIGAFQGRHADEAREHARKARCIKIPKPDPENWHIQYWLGPRGEFSRFDVIEADRPPHLGSSMEVRAEYLDLSFPRQFKVYDKKGCRLLISSFKHHYFGSSDMRLTKKRCEAFFDDPSNFVRTPIR